MRAIRVHAFGGPEVLELEDVPPPSPGPGEVVVRARAIGVNPVDAYIRAGTYGARAFPFTPGSDCAGTIDAIGPGVKRFAVGDRVYTSRTKSGAYAELVLCDEKTVHPLPARVGWGEGAGVGTPCATAYVALFVRGGTVGGDFVLVRGASGAVGNAAVQLARAAGATVIGTAGTEEGRRLARDLGAHHVIDHRAEGADARVLEPTSGRGVDVIVEVLANENLGRDLRLLSARGRVVVVGSRGPVEIDARDTMQRDADVRGMSLGNRSDDELARVHAALHAALEAGTLRVVVARELPLAEAARAHREVITGPARGKIVLVP